MKPRIIKSAKFEDGSFAILPPGEAQARREAAEAQAMASLDRLEQQAEDLLQAAQAEADRLLAQARREAEGVIASALSEAQQIRAQAHQDGQRSAMEELTNRYAQHLGAIAARAAQADAERGVWLANCEQDTIRLVLLIAAKILQVELSHSREAVLAMAESAMERLNDKTTVRLRVNPADLPLALAAKERLALGVEKRDALEIVADDRIGFGGCMVESRGSCVDARLSTQLAEIAGAFIGRPTDLEPEQGDDPFVAGAIAELGALPPMPTAKPKAALSKLVSRRRPEQP